MKKSVFLFFACVAFSYAGTNYFGTILLTDGVNIMPNVAVPTPEEVIRTKAEAVAVRSQATDASAAVAALQAQADALQIKAAALNGTTIVYGSAVSFGSTTVEANTNATAIILEMNLTSNVVDTLYVDFYVFFSTPLAGLPTAEHSVVLPTEGVGEWSPKETLSSQLTTRTVDGVETECYLITVGVPSANPSGFFRISGEAQETVVGQFLVLEKLTVNGVSGLDEYIPGIGLFKQGLLVELVEQADFDGGN